MALASQSKKSLSYRGLKRHFGDAAGVTKRCAASLFRQGGRDPVRARVRKLREITPFSSSHLPLRPDKGVADTLFCPQTKPVWEQLTLFSPS